MFMYANKIALITGASSGIGEAFAYSLAAKKCNLILVARNETKLKTLAKELSAKYNVKATVIALGSFHTRSTPSIASGGSKATAKGRSLD